MLVYVMPSRRHVFKTGKAYHLYDKSLDHALIFDRKHTQKAFIDALKYYRFKGLPISLSLYKRLSISERQHIQKTFMKEKDARVQIECFVLMPNHYHLIVRQKKEGGIVSFMSNMLNSFTRYYNRLISRKGPILLPQFRSIEILSSRQLIYTSKYIHVNPLRASLVGSIAELLSYKTSSLSSYIFARQRGSWIKVSKILKHFDFSGEAYWRYIEGN